MNLEDKYDNLQSIFDELQNCYSKEPMPRFGMGYAETF